MIFLSRVKNLMLAVDNNTVVKFKNGIFRTDDEELINKLLNHPEYNNKTSLGFFTSNKRTTTEPVKNNINPEDYILYGELKAKVITKEGKLSKSAKELDKRAFFELHKKLFNEQHELEIIDDEPRTETDN